MDQKIVGMTHAHDIGLVVVAALVCVTGACISALLSRRMSKATGRRKQLQRILTSLLAGTTIWSTHFIAMLAYDPGLNHGYEATRTVISLIVAVAGMYAAFFTFNVPRRKTPVILGGATFGITVSAMHYIGMSAYLVAGSIEWNLSLVAASIGLGVGLGIAAFHRLLRPVTRVCWLGGALFMVIAICAMHFTGMAAFDIVPAADASVLPDQISKSSLGISVFFVASIIFLFGFASFGIETTLEEESLDRMQHIALHDQLTGLPNRMQLNQKTESIAEDMARDRTSRVGVVCIDLNLFKEVNDLYGHAVGDSVLCAIAARLSAALLDDEFIARTGGDEFIALKQDFRRAEQVFAFAQRLHAAVLEPVETPHGSITVGAALGIATSIDDGDQLVQLLHKADLAMYRAKAQTDLHISFFQCRN